MAFVPSVTHKPTQAKQRSLVATIEALATQDGIEARGAIFTRPEVVDFILDLAGYTEDQPLHKKRILEPSSGGGDFLFAHRKQAADSMAGGKKIGVCY